MMKTSQVMREHFPAFVQKTLVVGLELFGMQIVILDSSFFLFTHQAATTHTQLTHLVSLLHLADTLTHRQ
jgi:hypothetical protein